GESIGLSLEFKHVEEVLRFASEDGPSGKELSLPLGWSVTRLPEELVFALPDPREQQTSDNYEYELPVPGRVVVPEAEAIFEAFPIETESKAAGYNAQHLFDATLLPRRLKVRNWRPGDRFWPAHTKSPKKIKELLQERHLAQPERKRWPVLANGDEIVWMRGVPAPAKVQAKPDSRVVLIQETTLAAHDEK